MAASRATCAGSCRAVQKTIFASIAFAAARSDAPCAPAKKLTPPPPYVARTSTSSDRNAWWSHTRDASPIADMSSFEARRLDGARSSVSDHANTHASGASPSRACLAAAANAALS